MIGAIGALIAGAVIWRLWPHGVLFLLLWPAALVAISLPTLSQTMADLGRPADVTPGYVILYYLQSLAITAVCFFIAFGIRKLVTRDRSPESESTEDA
ncbi:MAG: hypothetical protein ABIS38_03370 [Sphingomicrobium sp.]